MCCKIRITCNLSRVGGTGGPGYPQGPPSFYLPPTLPSSQKFQLQLHRPACTANFKCYFSNFGLQKNPIKCSVLTTFSHLGGQLGSRESTKGKSADVYCRSRSKVTFRGPIFEIFQVSTLVNQTSKNGPQMSKFLSRDAWGSW